ncbi:hypothetical protein PR202_ga18233 [Eleusine coracana subsp. coracana]|uniref:Uncharacterized protein n=1 Tax=Eleusine coracana subsp. coracana TaxID=191504 RepID=A0AAV5CRA3_ELECO|nr:hypothetical protein PR202_ga18233 [Eleusine coracana subsp. coracana]
MLATNIGLLSSLMEPLRPDWQLLPKKKNKQRIAAVLLPRRFSHWVCFTAEPEHQKFELKRKPFLLQLMGNLPEEELIASTLAAKLNAYAAELCPANTQKRISSKIDEIARKGWPILREI